MKKGDLFKSDDILLLYLGEDRGMISVVYFSMNRGKFSMTKNRKYPLTCEIAYGLWEKL